MRCEKKNIPSFSMHVEMRGLHFFVGLLCLSYLSLVNGEQLKPNGKNVCSKKIDYDGYVVVQSSYVGYENYMECCGLFCWSKCQKSRPVRKVYTKQVKRKLSRTEYFCCQGWGPVGGECLIPICKPSCTNGQCLEGNNCKCYPGFQGDRCDKEIDECDRFPPVCDHFCENIPGSYVCSCQKGYKKQSKDTRDGKCVNINECQASQSLCACANPSSSCKATCVDTDGGYQCRCSKGFKLAKNKLCVDENECTTGLHGCDHFCYNTNGKFSCGCKYGYVLDTLDKKTCKDINECSLSNGGCEQICENYPGTFTCNCRNGFKLLYDKRTCQDIDECVSRRPCDPTRGICYNTRGSFRCGCKQGYELQFDSVICEDKNECDQGTHGCSHQCVNLIGSYECRCPTGFVLSNDGKTCLDTDECKTRMHDCTQICVNEPGGFKCRCHDEYQLESDRKTCTPKPCPPLPRISSGQVNCPSQSVGSNCSYSCYHGYELKGNELHTCLEKQIWSGKAASCQPMACPHATPPINGKLILPCFEHFNSRCVVACNYGYYLQGSGFTECSIKDGRTFWKLNNNYCKALHLCTPNPCQHGGRCHVLSSHTYKCDCRSTGYIGDECDVGVIEFPSFPAIETGQESPVVNIQASPQQEVIITPLVPNNIIEFVPSKIVVVSPQYKAEFKIVAKDRVGNFRVSFNLSGINANDFALPTSVLIRVVSSKYQKLTRFISEDVYINQCNKKVISKCKNNNEINLYSTCAFDGLDTSGHVSVGTDSYKVPFSITGFSSVKGDTGLVAKEILTPRADIANALRKGVTPCDIDKCNEHLSGDEHQFAVKNNFFMRAYLKQLTSIAPWWFNVFLTLSYKGFDNSNFQSLVYKGDVPKKLQSCPNLPSLKNSTFSIFTSKVLADINFMSSKFGMEKISTSCILTDLCDRRFYLSLPAARSIDVSSVIAKLGISDTFLQISGIGMATSGTVDRKCVQVYKGIHLVEKCVAGNVWSKFILYRKQSLYNITFEGDAVFNIHDIGKVGISRFDEPYESIGNGELDSSVKFPLTMDKSIDVEFSDPLANVYKVQTGTKNSDVDGSTLITKLKHIKFNFNSPMITFMRNNGDEDSQFEVVINYSINGGSVQSVSDQSQLRIKLTLLMNNINALVLRIQRLTSVVTFAVETPYLLKMKTLLFGMVNKLRYPVKYQELYTALANLRRDSHLLKDFLELISAKLRSEPSITSSGSIIGQIKGMILLIDKLEFLPTPQLNKIEETFYGGKLKFHSQFCLHRLCFKNCFISITAKLGKNFNLQCYLKRDEELNRYMKVNAGAVVLINVDALTAAYDMKFKAKLSLFNQVKDADVFITPTECQYIVRNFSLEDGIITDLVGKSKVNLETTWDTLNFKLEGSFPRGSTAANSINTLLQAQMKKIVLQTQQQIDAFNKQLNSPRIKNMGLTKVIASKALKAAQMAEKVMKKNLNDAKVSLQRKRLLFKSYQVNSYLRDYEARLDKNVCKLKQCPKSCAYVNICNICKTTESVKAKTLRCKNVEKKVRLTSEEAFSTQCNEVVKAYKSFYTGTCHGGGESHGIKGALPDWGAGIGSTIGGPVGALIGGLTGGVIGQFFLGCEHTWSKYAVKTIASVPCTKIRLNVREETWLESECNEYEETVLSEFGKPVECNCTRQCIESQDTVCISDNKRCLDQRKVYLDNMLTRAGVFNATATSFIEAEKNVTLWETRYQKSKEKLQNQEVNYNRIQGSYEALLRHKHSLEYELLKLSKSQSFESCLLNENKKNETMQIDDISFRSNFRTRITNLVLKSFNKEMQLQVDLFEIKDKILQNQNKILKHFICEKNFGYSLQTRTYEKSDINIDDLCNRMQKLYSFTMHPLVALEKLVGTAMKKVTTIQFEVRELNRQMLLLLNGNNNLPKESEIELISLKSKINELNKEKKSQTPSQAILYWFQDMERYSEKASLYENFGFIDSIKKSFDEFLVMKKYSGYNPYKYENSINSASSFYHYFFTKASSSIDLKNLQTTAKVTSMLLTNLKASTNFCNQILDVELHPRSSKNLQMKVGETTKLSCIARSSIDVRYSWYKNQKKVPWQHEASLILNINPYSGGSYRCKVENALKSNISKEATINVYSPPVITEQPTDTTVIASEDQKLFTISCNATGIPQPFFGWYFKPFNSNTPRFLSYSNLLRFRVNDSLTSGFYYCKAANKHGSALSKTISLNIVKSCVAHQAFLLSFDMPREEVTIILEKIFYSENARKAWSTSDTQKITLSVVHQRKRLSKIIFQLKDYTVDDKLRCSINERDMLAYVSKAKANIVKLLKNVLKTMSVKVNENSTIAEIRENSRATLLLESDEKEFCPRGYTLHDSQIKCIQCNAGEFEKDGKCVRCPKGTFNESPGLTSCRKCASGKTTSQDGSPSQYMCT